MWPSNLFYLGLILGLIIGAGGLIVWAVLGIGPPEADWQPDSLIPGGDEPGPPARWPGLSKTMAEKDQP